MKIITSFAKLRRHNARLAKVRLQPFRLQMNLPKTVLKEIHSEFMNCFAQGVLAERNA